MRKTIKTGMYACLFAAALMTSGCAQKTEAVQSTEAETKESVGTQTEETKAEEIKEEETKAEETETEALEAAEDESKEEEAEPETAENELEETEAENAAEEEASAPVLSELYHKIEQTVELNVPMLVPDDFIINYYGIDLAVLEDYLFEMSEAATSAEMVVVMKVKEGEDTNGIEAALREVVNSKAAEMENYLPDQFELVKKSELKVKAPYVYLVISEHADVITEIIEAEL